MKIVRRIVGGAGPIWRLSAAVIGLAMALPMSGPAQAQEPVDCDSIGIELEDIFRNPICHKVNFRGSGLGRTESIQGETPDFSIHFQTSRSGAGNTYLHALDFAKLAGFYGLTGRLGILGAEKEAGDGFDYVSIGGKGLTSCILFLKQTRPISSGYRAQYYGMACDKARVGEYSEAEAAALLELVKDY